MKRIHGLLLFILAASVLLTGCVSVGGNVKTVRGTGSMVTHTIDAADFTAIEMDGAYNMTFRQSDVFSVTLEIQSNLYRHVEIGVERGVLTVGSDRNFSTTPANTPRLIIYAPDLNGLDVSGAVNANISLDTDRLNVGIAGAAKLTLEGSANRLNIAAAGATSVSAFDFTANAVTVNVAGAGNVDVYASETLDVTISGAGRVRYDGNPDLTRNVTGVGVVTRR
ncbi:MAG: DUF2807 domain-containing protein [Defluviitaleaceae bacterium]|nr:DUF2807 domain-containing protein [Defluviitaleaceae bacterium]